MLIALLLYYCYYVMTHQSIGISIKPKNFVLFVSDLRWGEKVFNMHGLTFYTIPAKRVQMLCVGQWHNGTIVYQHPLSPVEHCDTTRENSYRLCTT